MADPSPPEFTSAQIRTLRKLSDRGFQWAPMERITRHIVLEKDGFIALLDPGNGKLKLFGQVGYRLGEGIGVLVQRGGGEAFVWKEHSVPASKELLGAFARVKEELANILEEAH